ncbi:MAG: AAA family ATPase [Chloroflexi bacterium]|nr:AAA family ATPase [Ardenticatenaceae bacterium]MBL1128679.1 GAF domain-containing protein [Chloroflexota bacterium]NOG34758.1 AAA family ATPase [Chloroflexota bacterium]GIK57563.1 MAG: serine/threonine protein kinase [Chloroflexota bacterium]
MFPTFPGYQLEQKIYESGRTAVYRAQLVQKNCPVVLKVLQSGQDSPEIHGRFRQEYHLTTSLNGSGVIRALALEEQNGLLAMALEDFGGQSLAHWLNSGRLEMATFLPLAIQTSDALAAIHQQNLIHKDINPANIVWNRDTAVLKIIDFGLATTLPRENLELRSPHVLEGTLAYISPEQTGRMNRAMDYRSDLYSLGITFYQLCTGELPFTAVDPLELLHAHIARPPRPPQEIAPQIPQRLADIILRLLAKNAEDRYQSAYGLKADLEECWRQWQENRTIALFPLAQHDVGFRFQLPQKLYGRADPTATLLQAFHQMADPQQGAVQLALVAGPAGIGKSALVQELYRPVTARRGYFIAGKFDQLQNAPYAPLIAAFNNLLNQILTESQAALTAWREKLQTALGANGQVITDVLPNLELIIGPQRAVPYLPPAEAETRFNLTFQNFIRVFAQASHPLVLFLDDWQWMDGASRQIIQNLLTSDGDGVHLLLIGAYRDNEMPANHPIWLTIEKVSALGTAVHTITLSPLTLADVSAYVADTLHTTAAAAHTLAELVHTKTGGNPFFVGEFMKSLYTDGYITFDHAHGRWQWELARVQAAAITDNVVTLMTAAIQKLDLKTQMVLTLAACIGSRFDLHTLALVYGAPPADTAVTLRPAIQNGLLIPLSDNYRLAEQPIDLNPAYKFAHDRIQQAAYDLLPAADRQSIHWQIGQHLKQGQPTGSAIFEMVNHLNLGRSRLTQPANRLELARLNLAAAQTASEANAFSTALEYAQIGRQLLPPDAWQTEYDLALGLHVTAVSAAAFSANFPLVESISQAALPHTRTLLDRVSIYRHILTALLAQNKLAEELDIALPLLQELGINLPRHPTRQHLLVDVLKTRLALRGKTTTDLLHQPVITDPQLTATIEIMTQCGGPAYFTEPLLFALVVLRLIRLYAQRGNHPEGARAYAAYGLMLAGYLNDTEGGYAFGELGLNLVERLHIRAHYPGTAQLFYHYLNHWKNHLRDSVEPLANGYQIGLETGALEFAMNCGYSLATHNFYAGVPLSQVIPQMEQFAATMEQFNQHKLHYVLTMFLQTAVNLHTAPEIPWQLTGDHFDEATGEAAYRHAGDQPALCTFLVQKATLLTLFGHYRAAQPVFAEIETVQESIAATYMTTIILMLDALNHLALYPTATAAEQKQIKKRVDAALKKLAIWADMAPMNFRHKYELVAAERERVYGRPPAARRLYAQAIAHAHASGYLQEEALAYELAGNYYEQRGLNSLAQYHVQQAHRAYHRWGARAKMRHLESRFPAYFAAAPTAATITSPTTTASSVSSTAVLDLGSVVKASQALSGEIRLDYLLNRLMELLIENAGAQAGWLLLPHEDEWQIVATGGDMDGDTTVSPSILNYVTRTREHLVLDDAIADSQFAADPVIAQRQSRSVLCLPLLHHDNLTGVLYLENNLAPGAFTAERLKVLNLLASQAAISIENARLYGYLQEYGRSLEQQVEQRTAALAQANLEAQAARAAAEAANENKSIFLSNMSRELRTPLNTIIGFTRIVKQNGAATLPDKQLDNLDKVLVSADHLLSLINTVIDIAKIETGHMDVQPAEFDAAALTASCIATVQPLLRENVTLHTEFSHNLPLVYSDPAKVKQIIINLLSNAAKFTHQGRITVQLTARGDTLTLAVSDTGIGISPQALLRIFEEFEQAESTIRQQYGGTGLGLPISRSLARLLGGDLTAASTLSAGSTFTLTIPVFYRDA